MTWHSSNSQYHIKFSSSLFNDVDKLRKKIVEIATGINGSRVPFCYGIERIDDCDILTLILMDTITARQNFEDERDANYKWLIEHDDAKIETTAEGVKVLRGRHVQIAFGDFRDQKVQKAIGLDDDSLKKNNKSLLPKEEKEEKKNTLTAKLKAIKVYKIEKNNNQQRQQQQQSPETPTTTNKIAIIQETTGGGQQQYTTTKNEQIQVSNRHVGKGSNCDKNDRSSPHPLPEAAVHPRPPQQHQKPIKTPKAPPVSTTVRQTTGYLTIEGIESETSYQENQWPSFVVKEKIENCYDFHNDYYPKAPKELRKISIHAKVDRTAILRITTRNSNVNNVTVFEPLEPIFDYNNWSSTKRNQNRGTSGALGDALKRILGMGYASWTSDAEARAHEDDPSFIEYKQLQWPEPIILRFNKQEWRVYLVVEDGPNPVAKIEGPFSYEDASNYTEVKVALPTHINPNWPDSEKQYNEILDQIEKYYRICRLAKRNIEFSFSREVEK